MIPVWVTDALDAGEAEYVTEIDPVESPAALSNLADELILALIPRISASIRAIWRATSGSALAKLAMSIGRNFATPTVASDPAIAPQQAASAMVAAIGLAGL